MYRQYDYVRYLLIPKFASSIITEYRVGTYLGRYL
jgi:hypothetical protein